MQGAPEPIRILVAEEGEDLCSALNSALAEYDHEVIRASNGAEALNVLRKHPCPLVFTDIALGDMSGIDLLKIIRRENEETEVVIATSGAEPDTAIAAMRAGAYDCLVKPFSGLEMISSVARRAVEKIRLAGENRLLLAKLKQKSDGLDLANRTLQELAIRDGLTGLYNHRYFQETIASEIFRSRRYRRFFSVVFIDIDYFKKYNDVHGHPEGDKLLIALSRFLLENIRSSDFVARYGGEKFVMLLPETSKEHAVRVADGIRKKTELHPFEGRRVLPSGTVTVSMGVTTYPEDGTDVSTLVLRADQLLHEAKRKGKNTVRWDSASHRD